MENLIKLITTPAVFLTFLIGAALFPALLYFQYSFLAAVSLTIIGMIAHFSVIKTLQLIYNVAYNLHKLIKKIDLLGDEVKEKLGKTDISVNDAITPKLLVLISQLTSTLAALEQQMPKVGKALRAAEGFSDSAVGGFITGIFSSKDTPPPPAAKGAPAPTAKPPAKPAAK